MPFIFIATNRLKPGAEAAERRRVPELVEFIERTEPRMLAFDEYLDTARGEVTVVQIHPDSHSMETHLEAIRQHAAGAYAETIERTTNIQALGAPSPSVLAVLRRQAGSGVPITSFPEHLGGFTRLGGGAPVG
jgi:hypothetical protein